MPNINVLKAASLLGRTTLQKMGRAKNLVWEDLIAPHFLTRTIQTLMRVGFFEELRTKGSVIGPAFAERHDLDERLFTALCESLLARDYLKRDGGTWSLTTQGMALVDTDLARGWFDLAYGYENVLFNMEPLLRKQMVYGEDILREGRAVAVGSGLASHDFYFAFVLDLIQSHNHKRVLDVGCGDAHFLRMMCQRDPGVNGVGIDMTPAAIQAGNEFLREEGLTERIQLYVCNALELKTKQAELAGVDAAVSFFVVHELCDGKGNKLAIQFLKAFREALPGVPFNLVEPIRPSAEEMHRRPGPAIEYFLFHDLSNQNPLGRDQWRDVFDAAGYASVEEHFIGFARSSIFTIK